MLDFETNWKKGVHRPKYDAKSGSLVEVSHCGGDSVPAPAWCSQINKNWEIANNWSDWDAQFELKDSPTPPIQCRLLFHKDKLGPIKMDSFRTAQSQKAFEAWVETAHVEHQARATAAAAVARAAAGPAPSSHSTTTKLDALKRSQAKAAAQTAKTKAQNTLSQRQAKRRVLFRSDSTASGTGAGGGGASSCSGAKKS